MGLGGIPLSEIRGHGRACGIADRDDLADFCEIVQAMDGAFLKEEAERAKREGEKGKVRGRR